MITCDMKKTAALISAAGKIAITAHVKPDPDALGSTLALGLALRKIGKEVLMTVDDELPTSLGFMPHLTDIKNLDEFSNQAVDLLIVLDASDRERSGRVPEVFTGPILNIDHHISNKGFSDYRYLDVKAAATGEIIYQLLIELNVDMDLDIAKNLYTAIVTDCGFFQYSNTTKKTMEFAAQLLDHGVKPDEIQYALESKTRSSVELLAEVLKTLEFFAEDKIAVLSLENNKYDPQTDTEGFISFARYISGVEIAVFIKEIDTDITRVSMRSRDIDVSNVALHFGGGGHARAAGCTIKGNLAESKKLLLEQLKKVVAESQHA